MVDGSMYVSVSKLVSSAAAVGGTVQRNASSTTELHRLQAIGDNPAAAKSRDTIIGLATQSGQMDGDESRSWGCYPREIARNPHDARDIAPRVSNGTTIIAIDHASFNFNAHTTRLDSFWTYVNGWSGSMQSASVLGELLKRRQRHGSKAGVKQSQVTGIRHQRVQEAIPSWVIRNIRAMTNESHRTQAMAMAASTAHDMAFHVTIADLGVGLRAV